MDDFPRTVAEFEVRFATEDACRAYLCRLRWPDGFRCRCGDTNAWWTARGLWQCATCGAQTSVTAGTVFQDTRKPLRLWFHAMWWVASQKTGGSALGLQRLLGLGRYETAWTWLHKLRRAMVRPGRDRLAGHVEVDETYLGAASRLLAGGRRRKKRWWSWLSNWSARAWAAFACVGSRTRPPTACRRLSTRPSSRAASCTPMAGRGITQWRATAIAIRSPSCGGSRPRRPGCCHTCIASSRCFGAGSSAPIRGRSLLRIWTTTSMSLRFDSTVARLGTPGNCSSASLSRQSPWCLHPTRVWSSTSGATASGRG